MDAKKPEAVGRGQVSVPLTMLRQLGPTAALLVAAGCGWEVARASDLLTAAVRGAAAWVAVLALWRGGLWALERILQDS